MSRVQEIMEMIANETDPDKLQVLEFDLRQAMGRKDADMKKSVKKRAGGGSPMTDKQKKSATSRKRRAQNKANRGGKQSAGQGKKPIYVSTKPKK